MDVRGSICNVNRSSYSSATTLPKLVVHQAHFLVDRQNDVRVATAWCHFAANTLSDRGAVYHLTFENIVPTLINVDQPDD